MYLSNVHNFNPVTPAIKQKGIYSKKYVDLSHLAEKLFEDLKTFAVQYKLDDDFKMNRFMALNILKQFYKIDWNFNDTTFTETAPYKKSVVVGCRQFDVTVNVGDDDQITLFQPSPRTLPECTAFLIEILSKFHNELLHEIICSGMFKPTCPSCAN